MHGVYVIRSRKDGQLYIGYSRDIKRRLAEHNDGRVPATVNRRPFAVLYCELFANQKDAMQRELYLKSGWGRKYLQRTLSNALQNKKI